MNTYRFAACLQLLFCFFCTTLAGQTFTGAKAAELVPGAETVVWNEITNTPSFVLFSNQMRVSSEAYDAWEKKVFELDENTHFKIKKSTSGKAGFTHVFRQQYFNDILVNGAISVLHFKDGMSDFSVIKVQESNIMGIIK